MLTIRHCILSTVLLNTVLLCVNAVKQAAGSSIVKLEIGILNLGYVQQFKLYYLQSVFLKFKGFQFNSFWFT